MGRAVFPPCSLAWDQTMVEVMKIMVTSFKRSQAYTAVLSVPWPCSRPPPTHTFTRDSWILTGKLDQSLEGSLLLSPGSWCIQGSVCALLESVSPVLCKFWWLSGGVNGDLLQESLCHTQVCCNQSPCPAAGHCWPVPPQDILKHSSGSVSVGSLGPGAHKVCLSLPSVSGRYGVWF